MTEYLKLLIWALLSSLDSNNEQFKLKKNCKREIVNLSDKVSTKIETLIKSSFLLSFFIRSMSARIWIFKQLMDNIS